MVGGRQEGDRFASGERQCDQARPVRQKPAEAISLCESSPRLLISRTLQSWPSVAVGDRLSTVRQVRDLSAWHPHATCLSHLSALTNSQAAAS